MQYACIISRTFQEFYVRVELTTRLADFEFTETYFFDTFFKQKIWLRVKAPSFLISLSKQGIFPWPQPFISLLCKYGLSYVLLLVIPTNPPIYFQPKSPFSNTGLVLHTI